MKSFADLRHTLYNLQPYSISEETRSEHWVATPILPAPVKQQSLTYEETFCSTQSHAGMITYNFHPPFRIVK